MPDDQDKESEIINRHCAEMVIELNKSGFKAEAAVAFVVFKGVDNFNLVTLLSGSTELPSALNVDAARLALLNYAHDEICGLIDQLEDSPPDGKTH